MTDSDELTAVIEAVSEPDPAPQPATVEPEPAEMGSAGTTPIHREILSEIMALRSDVHHFHQLIDRLHRENEELRRGQIGRVLEPVLRDVVKISDDWRRMGASWTADRESARPEEVVKICQAMVEDADMILERHGVEASAPAVGSTFDRREQRAVTTVPSTARDRDATIAGVVRPGYRFDGRLLRFSDVEVYRYAPPEVTAAEPEPSL